MRKVKKLNVCWKNDGEFGSFSFFGFHRNIAFILFYHFFSTMVKPSPIPEFLVVKLGSKICSNLSLGIPIPLSSITMMIFLLKSSASDIDDGFSLFRNGLFCIGNHIGENPRKINSIHSHRHHIFIRMEINIAIIIENSYQIF